MLEPHPLAGLFPMMSARETQDLRADLAANGLTDPIITYEGRILDGRNRYAACLAIGIVPHTRAYTGPNPLAFVLSKELNMMCSIYARSIPMIGKRSKLR